LKLCDLETWSLRIATNPAVRRVGRTCPARRRLAPLDQGFKVSQVSTFQRKNPRIFETLKRCDLETLKP